ncbi:MAG TPA: TetR family transcriptional regulator [Candidatus Limnocylindrales bacterium]
MMSMSISYEETGRTRQKARTREAVIAAARAQMAVGTTPTVEQAADAAGVSRATAYRYFPNQRTMLVAAYPEIAARSLLGADPPDDVAARLDRVVDEVTRMLIDKEPELRTMLRLSLEADEDQRQNLLLRQGRVIGWLEEALQPLRRSVSKAELRRLVYAIRCAVGIEALVWLCDVAGLSRREAVEVMRWSASGLLRAALADVDAKGSRRKRRGT